MIYLLLFTITATGFQSDKAIRIDGVLKKDEWKGAQEYQLGKGNKLLIQKSNDALYAAMVSENGFWAHFYLSDGNIVKVMHASAALDAVEYKKNNSLWLTQDTFQYEMRDTVYNAETEAKMLKYFTKNGWIANNVNLGSDKTIEFKVNISQWKKPLYFACVMANFDMTFHPFPANLNDNTVLPRLVQGYTPDSLNFEPVKWEKIKAD